MSLKTKETVHRVIAIEKTTTTTETAPIGRNSSRSHDDNRPRSNSFFFRSWQRRRLPLEEIEGFLMYYIIYITRQKSLSYNHSIETFSFFLLRLSRFFFRLERMWHDVFGLRFSLFFFFFILLFALFIPISGLSLSLSFGDDQRFQH